MHQGNIYECNVDLWEIQCKILKEEERKSLNRCVTMTPETPTKSAENMCLCCKIVEDTVQKIKGKGRTYLNSTCISMTLNIEPQGNEI